MALNAPIVVRVEKKPERSFGETMNELRIWLDHHNIDSTSFTPVAKADSAVGFEIGFGTEDEASLFRNSFALSN
jgi:hypothetical protein